MLIVLSTIYSWPFAIGALIGFVFRVIYCHARANWENKHHPRADGLPHPVQHISRVWLAGLVALLSVGYGIYSSEQLAHDVHRCWNEQYQQVKAQTQINAQNDSISRQQQSLQRDYDRSTSDWLKALISPPGDLANEPTDSPERKQWGLDITGQYQKQLNELGSKYDDLVNQRAQLDAERAQHPLPETTCGK